MSRRLPALIAALLLATASPLLADEVKNADTGASVEALAAEDAIATLVVRDKAGKETARFDIRPVSGDKFGLRAVDEMRWISRDRIAVSGTVNPSTIETVIVDAGSGEEVDSILSNGNGVTFSADGKHFAYVDGEPHFAEPATYESTLKVDHDAVFPKAGKRVAFVAVPVFSADGSRLAFAYAPRDAEGAPLAVSLGVWRAGKGIVVDKPYADAKAADGVMLSAAGSGFEAAVPGQIAATLFGE